MSETPRPKILPPLPPEVPDGPKLFRLVLKVTAPLPPEPAVILILMSSMSINEFMTNIYDDYSKFISILPSIPWPWIFW